MEAGSATLDVVPAAVVVLETLVEAVESSASAEVFIANDVTLVCVVDGELDTEEDSCAEDV